GAAAPRPAPEPRGVVRGAVPDHRGAARRDPRRRRHDPGEPLPAPSRARPLAARASLLDLVRDAPDRGLARALPREGRRLRPPAPPAAPDRRRRPLPRGVSRLRAPVGSAEGVALRAPDLAGRALR